MSHHVESGSSRFIGLALPLQDINRAFMRHPLHGLLDMHLNVKVTGRFGLRQFLNDLRWQEKIGLSEIIGFFDVPFPSVLFDELLGFATHGRSLTVHSVVPICEADAKFDWFGSVTRKTVRLTRSEYEVWRKQELSLPQHSVGGGLHVKILDQFQLGNVPKRQCDVFGPAEGGPYRLFCDEKLRDALSSKGLLGVDYLPLHRTKGRIHQSHLIISTNRWFPRSAAHLVGQQIVENNTIFLNGLIAFAYQNACLAEMESDIALTSEHMGDAVGQLLFSRRFVDELRALKIKGAEFFPVYASDSDLYEKLATTVNLLRTAVLRNPGNEFLPPLH